MTPGPQAGPPKILSAGALPRRGKGAGMFRSLHMKLVLIMLLLITS